MKIFDKEPKTDINEQTDENYGELKVKDNKIMNTAAKILAFLCAVIIWFFAVGNESPHYERTYTNLTVNITGVQQGMSVMSGGGSLVDLTVKGIRSDVYDLEKENIRVYADASSITSPGRYDLPVTVDLENGITVQSFSRDTVSVYISTASQRVLPLSVKLTDYSMPPSCTVKTSIKGESTITVFGPKEELDKISSAGIVVSPGNLTSALTCSGSIKLYDASGEEYSNTYVTQSLHEAMVEIELMTTADIELTVDTVHGYFTPENTQITLTPSKITVTGRYEDIADITTINVYTLDETDIISDSVLHAALELPDGMTSVDQISDIVIDVKHTGTSVRNFSVPSSSIRFVGTSTKYTYTPTISSLTVKVRGENSAEFSSMSQSDITVTVDVSSSQTGTTILPATVTVSKNGCIYIIGEYTVPVSVSDATAQTDANV